MADFRGTPFLFGAFRLHPGEHTLTRDGESIALTPKEFDTLLALVEARGRVVGKEELIRRVWPDSYVGDGSLARNISVLRKALGEDLIETVPRRGYRITTAVAQPEAGGTDATEERSPVSVPDSPAMGTIDRSNIPQANAPANLPATLPKAWSLRPRWISYGAILFLAFGIVGLLTWNSVSHAKTDPLQAPVRIAVLPFANYTGNPQQDYLCDGLTEAMISELSRLNPDQLSVIARTSAMKFKSTQKSIPEIARELNADYILESSVRGSGDRVRVTAQLVRGTDASHLWTGEYERGLQNVADVQQEVAIALAEEIRLKVDAAVKRRLHGTHSVDPETYQDYLLGRYNWTKRNREGLMKSVELFERAISRDPGYAPAYAGLADSYLVLGGGYLPDIETYNKARVAALKAMELDKTLSEPYTSLAYEKFVNERDMAGADEDYQRSIMLDANNANAHHWYAIFLSAMKRHDEAIQHINRALELDPLAIGIRYNAGSIYLAAGRTDEALSIAKHALEMDPASAPAHGTLARVYLAKGEYEQALAEMRAAQDLRAEASPYAVEEARIYAMEGKTELARQQLAAVLRGRGWTKVAPYTFALTYAELGEKDKAFYWLQRSIDDHSCTASEINTDPGLDPLRPDARFSQIARLFAPR